MGKAAAAPAKTTNRRAEVNRKRSYKEIKIDKKVHHGSLAELPPDRKALEAFRHTAYQAPYRQVHRMTLGGLVDTIYKLKADQAYMMSDPVPDWLIQAIEGQHEDVAGYLARNYKIGGGGSGNDKGKAKTVQGIAAGTEDQ